MQSTFTCSCKTCGTVLTTACAPRLVSCGNARVVNDILVPRLVSRRQERRQSGRHLGEKKLQFFFCKTCSERRGERPKMEQVGVLKLFQVFEPSKSRRMPLVRLIFAMNRPAQIDKSQVSAPIAHDISVVHVHVQPPSSFETSQ